MKKDRNGYGPSIFEKNEEDRCFLCGRWGDCARHEIYFGSGNRAISKAYGFWVCLCPDCHNRVHSEELMRDGITLDMHLKRATQEHYEVSHSRAEFMRLIGRNYL